jgi:hypothetical protein
MLRRTKLNSISKHKLQQLKDELPIRVKLCERAGGTWVKANNLVGGYCRSGICECGCGRPPGYESDYCLHPHEKIHRGLGGKLSMRNSKMMRNDCHDKEQGNVINPAKRSRG